MRSTKNRRAFVVGATLWLALGAASPALAWGEKGHTLGNRAAAEALPEDAAPALKGHGPGLGWLGVEPDRWRSRSAPALDKGGAVEHYFDMECWGDPHDLPPDRWSFLKAVVAKDPKGRFGIEPEDVGLAPYRALELAEQLELQLASAARLTGPEQVAAAEAARSTAGIMGHYVMDLSNPHHTSIHHHGWKGENPKGYTTDPAIHHAFEGLFVDRVVTLAALSSAVAAVPVRRTKDLRGLIVEEMVASHGALERLYQLEAEGAFKPGNEKTEAGERGTAFVLERLAAGAATLRDLWLAASEVSREATARDRQAAAAREALTAAGFERLFLSSRRDGTYELRGEVADPDARAKAIAIAKKALPEGASLRDGTRLPGEERRPRGETPRPPKPDAQKPDAPKPGATKPDAPKPTPKPDAPKPAPDDGPY